MITYGRSPQEINDDATLAILDAVQIVEGVFDGYESVRKRFPRWKSWTLDELLECEDKVQRIRWHLADALLCELGYLNKWGTDAERRFNKALKALGV